MSDINLIYTAQTKTAPASQPLAGNGPVTGIGTGIFGGGAGSFFDLIFSRLTDTEKKKDDTAGNPLSLLLTQQANPANPAKPAKADPALPLIPQKSGIAGTEISVIDFSDLDISGSNPLPLAAEIPGTATANSSILSTMDPEIKVAGDEIAAPVLTVMMPRLDMAGQKKLKAALENLLQGLPADQRPVIVNIQPGQLKKAMGQLKTDSRAIEGNSQNLIATGLTPEQLEKLVTLIGKGKPADDDQDNGADIAGAFLIGIVKMMPDNDGKEAVFIPRALFISKPDENSSNESQAPDELAASLNALTVGGTANVSAPAAPAPETQTVSPGAREPAFDDVLKSLEQQAPSKGGEIKNSAPDSTPKNNAGNAGPANSTLGTGFSGMMGSLMNSASLNDLFPDGMDWSQNPIAGLNNTHMTGSAQLTSLVTQAQQATQPHPVTQMVAATLSRAARNGEDQTLRLQLDPPELGRIEVHMHFTKDKTMKAHMVIEKPETMLMMQRDAHTLERALHDSGIGVSGNSLSFELSGQGQAFDGNGTFGGHGGAEGHAGGPESSDIGLIESTMTWYVDAETGQQHYNILA
jgi:hypothetical protein